MLKVLMLNKKAEKLREELENLSTREAELVAKSEELAEAIEEVETEEELEVVEGEVNEVSEEKEKLEEEKDELEEKLKEIEEEIAELEEKKPEDDEKERSGLQRGPEKRDMGVRNDMMVNKFETREQMLSRINKDENKEFYRAIIEHVKLKKRTLTGGDLTIPTDIVNMIHKRVADMNPLYNEITVHRLNGNGRVFVDGSIPKGIWTECCDPLEELDFALKMIELDCYKVGGYTALCNAIIDDSAIDLINYIDERIAMSISLGLLDGIVLGDGNKKPLGFMNADIQKISVEPDFKSIVKAFGEIGEEGVQLGRYLAIMNRKTYYAYVISNMMRVGDNGQWVVTDEADAVFPDGTRIKIIDNVPENTIIVGDFKRYILGERKSMTITSSDHVQFIQDNTVIKGIARYDGKPAEASSFAILELEGSLGE